MGGSLMEYEATYEYDAECEVLIRCDPHAKIISKDEPVWRNLGPKDDSYARAIYLGQGCWNKLDTISEEKALDILSQWGYVSKDKEI